MKTTDIPVLKIEKTLGRAKRRRALRGVFVQKLGVGHDEHELDRIVDEYFASTEAAGRRAAEPPRDRHRTYAFLENALALFLLASESGPRAEKFISRLLSLHHINKHEDTTLLAFILKALGPYQHGDRRTVHRDSTVLEYLISQNVLPSAVPSYLATRGQGIDDTYDVAQDFFNSDSSGRRRRCQLTIEPKAAAKFTRQTTGQYIIALVVRSANGVIMKDCLIDPAQVREVIDFIKSMRTAETGSRTES